MPFFPQAYFNPEASFLQILSELDQPQQKSCGPRRHTPRSFTPRFDVTEATQAYELFGEVPGLEQKDLEIEFSDAQTLVIKGKVERPTTTTPAAQTTPQSEASDTASEKSHNVTVEDEYDEADTPLATPASTATATNETEAPAAAQKTEAAPKPKYWVAERRVGEFARSFSFAQRIDQDAVSANLKNGVLHVVVPKSQRNQKVVVNVI